MTKQRSDFKRERGGRKEMRNCSVTGVSRNATTLLCPTLGEEGAADEAWRRNRSFGSVMSVHFIIDPGF